MHNPQSYSFYMPKETWIGFGAVDKLGESLKKKGISRCLLVTDEFMAASEAGRKTVEILENVGIEVSTYKGVEPDPTIAQVENGTVEFLNNKCEALVSLGGGSPHDCAKAIKYALIQGSIKRDQIILAAVNTTAGTGSEVTQFAVITNEADKKKIPLVNEMLIPDIAIDDSALMQQMPKALTAATGMDALTHAMEAFIAKDRNYITNSASLKAVQLIDEYLIRAYKNGSDIEARDGMVYAQYMAGMAFSNAGLGVVHAMAHQIGGRYKLPHGLCNALLLPYGVSFNLHKGCDLYGELSITLNLCPGHYPLKMAGIHLVDYLTRQNRSLDLPLTLKEMDVKLEDIDLLAEGAMNDSTLRANPVAVTVEDLKAIYKSAFYGKL